MPRPSRASPFASPADCAACRATIRDGSKSFYLASKLLPQAVREPSYAVYAWCRWADDRIDRHGDADAVGAVRSSLDRIYAGRPGESVEARAFADVVRASGMPRDAPDALVEGLAWDAEGRRYASLSELRAYAVRVAGAVGVMMALVMGKRDPDVLARACDLGVAMQLTNICRDIGEDAAAGRLYLPLDMLDRAGVDADLFLRHPRLSPGLGAVIAALLGEAERLYDRALPGIAALPAGSRVGIGASRLLYREIGRRVLGGVDPVAARAVVPARHKLALLGQAVASFPVSRRGLNTPALAEAAFLLDAVPVDAPGAAEPLPDWWNLAGRTARLLDLLHAFGRAPRAPSDLSPEAGPKRMGS